MKSGISFEFGDASDFMLADTVMDTLFPKAYAGGQFEVQVGENLIGQAGRLDGHLVEAISQGDKVSFTGVFNDADYLRLLQEVRLVNANVDPTGISQAITVIGSPAI